MTLETVYFLTQIVAAMAIVASLVFVGLQVRTQAHETAMQRMEQRIAEIASLRSTVFSYPELRAAIFKANDHGLESLDREEFMLYASWARRLLVLAQLIQAGNEGKMPQRDSAAAVAQSMAMPGFKAFWDLVREEYETSFVTYVEAIVEWGDRDGFSEAPFFKLHPEA